MKKVLTFMFLMLAFIALAGQTITINSIGMRGANGAGDYDVSDNENITISVNYTGTDINRANQIRGFSFTDDDGAHNDYILLEFYSGSIPVDGDYLDEVLIPIETILQSYDGTYTDSREVNVGSFTSQAYSIQASLQLYTRNSVYSDLYSSHVSDSYYNTVVPVNSPGEGYQTYLTVYRDTATEAPTLYSPASTTTATYDNKTLLIDFKLNETPLANSVKLYFSNTADGSSLSTTLELANTYENTSRHQIEFNASPFSSASPHIDAVTGNSSLTHLNTYYVAIGYQDALGNPEAKSPWHKLKYDNAAKVPINIWGSSGTGSNFNVNFTLEEDSADDGITIYIKNSSTLATISTVEIYGSYAAGANSVSLDAANILSSSAVSSVADLNTLESGETYRFSVQMVDLAGNSATSVTSGEFLFLNQNITITATAAEHNPGTALSGYNLAAYQPIGYVALKTSSGTATLSALGVTVSGSIDAADASYLALYESPTTSFSAATSISNILPFTGTGNYSFPIANRTLTSSNKYYFVTISLNSADLTYCDRIEISTNSALITTSGTVNTFEPGIFADKCLYRALIVNYSDAFPAITPGTPNTPFFRLDVRTNQGTASVTSLKLALTGSLTLDDVDGTGFKVWESTSPTFATGTATQIGGSANFNQVLSFSGFNRSITNTGKYYFFTVTTKATANPEATIGGDVLEESYIGTNVNTTVETDNTLSGFPLTGDQQTLPVELTSFTALVIADNNVKIEWTVETETGLSGYYLLKSNTNDLVSANQIPVLIPSINSSQTYTYSFVDREVENNKVYYYWLKTVELSNESEFFGPIIVTIGDPNYDDTPEVILGTKLYNNYPNPFNPSTNISFSLKNPEQVSIRIYNIRGQLVKTLLDDFVSKTNTKQTLTWYGKDANNNDVASGVYYAKMIAGKHSEFKKMLLMK